MSDKERDEMPAVPMPNEAGDIGDEQLPAGAHVKTDKEEWNYSSDKAKREPILPERIREFLAGL
jgi:hypothetical protein